MSLLRVSNLSMSFGGVKAVDDVSFDVKPGELLALIGPNGAGKSTCFNIVNGQLRPTHGSVMLDGHELVGMRPRDIWRRGVGRTFQVAATFNSMTVLENVQMALVSREKRLYGLWKPAASHFEGEALTLLDQVGMTAHAQRACSVLAYGDVKRVEMAIALANRPKLLLMDEPTAGMTPRSRRDLMELATGLAERDNVAVLFTEHDMDIVFGFADRVLVLDRGALIAQGAPADIKADPRVKAVYLGLDEPVAHR
jgi:branched-chain amino acid transport system ATP-binding protein